MCIARPPRTLVLAGLVAWWALSALGCGKGSDEVLVPVSGTVRYKGSPLSTGVVVYVPDAEKGNTTQYEPRGTIDAQGRYQLNAAADKPGAPKGWYKVAVHADKPADPKNPYAVPTSLIPGSYKDAETSGLTVEVVAPPATGSYNLELK